MTENNPETPFSWARHDVDGDDYDELFIRLDSGFCTEGGCAVIGFRKSDAGNWPVILTTVAAEVAVEKGKVSTVSGGTRTDWSYDAGAGMLLPMAQIPVQVPPLGADAPKP